MTERRPLLVACLTTAAVVLLAGCGTDDQQRTGEPTPTGSADPSSSNEPSQASGSDRFACDRIDVAAILADTGVKLKTPENVGKIAGIEGCSAFVPGNSRVVVVDLKPTKRTLEQDARRLLPLRGDDTRDATVAGEPALIASDANYGVGSVTLATHVETRLLLVRFNGTMKRQQLTRWESVVQTVAEQIAAG